MDAGAWRGGELLQGAEITVPGPGVETPLGPLLPLTSPPPPILTLQGDQMSLSYQLGCLTVPSLWNR